MPTFASSENIAVDVLPRAIRTVLYVDDHPVNVHLMQDMFAKRPELRLVVATTGEAGLCAAIESKPRLLLMDLRLPDYLGTELLQRMREVDHLREVSAVAVTSEGASDLTEQGFREIWHRPMDMCSALMRLDCLLAESNMEGNKAAHSAMVEASGPSHGAPARRAAPDPIPFPNAAQRSADAQRSFHDSAA